MNMNYRSLNMHTNTNCRSSDGIFCTLPRTHTRISSVSVDTVTDTAGRVRI